MALEGPTPVPEAIEHCEKGLGVWEWEPEYLSAHSCCDVTYWHLRLDMDGRAIVVSGANAYPGSEGPEVSGAFRGFRAAVERLIGKEL